MTNRPTGPRPGLDPVSWFLIFMIVFCAAAFIAQALVLMLPTETER